jgi:hypothetical protein
MGSISSATVGIDDKLERKMLLKSPTAGTSAIWKRFLEE